MRAHHLGAACLISLALAAPAAADTRETFHFADPFDGTAQCDGFTNSWVGHDRGNFTNFFRDGVPYRQIGHIHAIETDTNLSTGKSIVVRTDITVVGELTPDGELAAYQVSGRFSIGTAPAQGILIHDAGVVRFDADGALTLLHGIHDTFTDGSDAFCNALA